MHLEYFSEDRIALSREVGNHPELCARLAKYPPQEFELRLAEIAAYCDVILDATYTQDDIDKLCRILWKKLVDKNCIIILPS